MAVEYPAVKKELTAIEQTLEAYSMKNQTAPKPSTFDKIKSEIQSSTPPSDGTNNRGKHLPLWLGILLGALGVILAIGFFNARQQQRVLELENEELNIALQECERDQQSERPMAILRENGTSTILLLDPTRETDQQAVVYFNPLSQKSYLDPFQLPAPESGKQYQLWALIDNQPTDMGVFDLPENGETFIEVPFIMDADAFAITLEPAGGSVEPTLTDLQVIGNRT